MGPPDAHGSRLSLAEIIDLELRLHADEDLPHRDLAERDARIARSIAPRRGDDDPVDFYRRWLRAAGDSSAESTGQKLEQALDLVSAIASLTGMVLGAAVVWGWLMIENGKPINVIHFWAATVGIQLALLLAILLLIVLPTTVFAHLPAARGALAIGRAIASLIPSLAIALISRFSAKHRLALAESLGRLRRVGRIYDRLSLMLLVRITQLFAIAFNIGAIISLVLAACVSDPSFGWRSTLLSEQQVYSVAQTIALPWRPLIAHATPDLAEVKHTHFTQLEARFGPLPPGQSNKKAEEPPPGVWAAWWPFLLASLITYGLIPRVLILVLASWRIRSILTAFPRNHPALSQILDRFNHHSVLTAAPEADPDPARPPLAPTGIMTHSRLTSSSYHVLIWAGVDLPEAALQTWLKERHRCQAASIRTIGQVDRKADTRALLALSADPSPAPLLVIVQAWEPPVGDYLDLLTEARRVLGPKRLIHVLLYHRGPNQRIRPPKPIEVRTWQSRINTLADGWITVEPMAEGAGT